VPDVMIEELEKMGPAAQPLLDEYNAMTDDELSETVDLFKEKHGLAKDMAVEEVEPLAAEILEILGISVDNVKTSARSMEKESKNFGNAGVNGFKETKNDFVHVADDMSTKAVAEVKSKIPDMGKTGTESGEAYADGVEGEISTSTEAAKNLSDAAVEEARSFRILNAWDNAGINSARKYAYGIDSRLGMVKDSATSMANTAKNAAGAISTYSTGQNAGQTFANGISSKWNQAYNAGYSLGRAANQGQRNALNIKSPSRVAKENAENFGQSFVDNLLKMKDKAAAAGQEFTRAAIIPLEQPVSVSANYSANGGGSRSLGAQNSGTPANINLSIGGRNFEAFVDDISQVQDVSTQLKLSYA
ncbi:MAG TPA: hypothetical protein VFF56_01390, partial [Bacillota bacterium]|nr:hypothetical protein [Bacillota bacterium]